MRVRLLLTALMLLLPGAAGAMPVEKKGSGTRSAAEELSRARARAQEEYRRMREARRRALEKARREALSPARTRAPAGRPGRSGPRGGGGFEARAAKGRRRAPGPDPADGGGSLPVILVGTLLCLWLGIRVFRPHWLSRREATGGRRARGGRAG